MKLERQQLENQNSRKRAEQAGEVQKLKMKLGALKGDLENSQAELADDSRTLRRRHSFSGAAQCRQRCAKWPGALPAWTPDAKPLARLMLNESGLAKLKSDQSVRFFFEAYPVSTLRRAERKARLGEPVRGRGGTGQYFVGLASLDEAANRHHLSLRPGMKGEARIRVGSRTLIEYAFEPIRQLREGIRN